ncbi:MAG: hypothetical protein HUK10_08655 [Bacteroides heparinolyticus]|nr:hypothetical protein [Bacteroides heparinolyticus]
MKKQVYSLIVLSICIFSSCSKSELEKKTTDTSIAQLLEKNIIVAQNHSNTLKQIEREFVLSRSVSEVDQKQKIYDLFKNYVVENNISQIFLEEDNSRKIIEGTNNSVEKISEYFDEDCFKEFLAVISNNSTKEELKNDLLQILEKNKNSKYINDYLLIAGVAIDSYSYWTTNAKTRSFLSGLTRIIKADVISAAAAIEAAGAAALITGATPPGAAAIAGTAAFGSAVEGVTMAFE